MAFERGEKKFLNVKTPPPFVIFIIWCRGGSPRRANLHLFFFFFLRGILTMSPPFSGISILPNLNLLRSELGVDYLFYHYSFPKQIVKESCKIQRIRGCLAATFSACFAQRRGNDRSVVTPSPLASVLKYLQVINIQVWPILAASLPYLDWFLPFIFVFTPEGSPR